MSRKKRKKWKEVLNILQISQKISVTITNLNNTHFASFKSKKV